MTADSLSSTLCPLTDIYLILCIYIYSICGFNSTLTSLILHTPLSTIQNDLSLRSPRRNLPTGSPLPNLLPHRNNRHGSQIHLFHHLKQRNPANNSHRNTQRSKYPPISRHTTNKHKLTRKLDLHRHNLLHNNNNPLPRQYPPLPRQQRTRSPDSNRVYRRGNRHGQAAYLPGMHLARGAGVQRCDGVCVLLAFG